jgi:hypothetical protein
MIPGYNHNVKYGETVYHVQTEDSGIENPHIITHLFVGGNIIESRKTSYADIVKNDNLKDMVVELMQGQHKAMLKELIKGNLDAKLAERSVNVGKLNGPAPLNVEAGAQGRSSFGIAGPASAPSAKPAARAPIPIPAAPAAKPAQPSAAAAAQAAAAAAAREAAAQAAAAGGPRPPSSFFGTAPPPDQIIEAETLQRAFDSKDESAIDSIFGEDLISEKSLDEVILSYLAEDMQKE